MRYIITLGRLEQKYDSEQHKYIGPIVYNGSTNDVNYISFPTQEAAHKALQLAEAKCWEIHSVETDDKYREPVARVAASKDILAYEAAEESIRQAEIKLKQNRIAAINKVPKVFSLGTFKDIVTDKLLSFKLYREDALLEGDITRSGTGYITLKYHIEITRSNIEKPMTWNRIEYYYTSTGQIRKESFYNYFKNFIGDEFLDEVMRELKGIYYRYNEVKKLLTTNIIEEEVKK